MNYNPYAAPQAAPPPPPGGYQPGTGGPQPWEIGEVLGAAWEAFKGNWAVLVFSYFLTMVISYIPLMIPAVLVATQAVEPNSTEYFGAAAPCYFVYFVIYVFFYSGLINIWVGAARGRTVEFGELFAGGGRFLPMLGAMLLFGIAVYLGFALILVPGFILLCGLFLAPFYVVEAKTGVIDSLKASWQATSGQKGKIFLFGVVCFLVIILGELACCIGVFVAMPVVGISGAIVYLRMSGRGAPPANYAAPPGYGGPPPGYGGPPPGYGGPPPGGYGGPPPGGGGYGGPPPGGGGYGGPPGGGYGPPGGGGYGPPGGGGGYGGPQGGGGGYGGPPGA